MIIHTSYKSIVYLYVYTICILHIYIQLYIYCFCFFELFLLWHQILSGPLPDVGVDLVLPGHPLPEIFGSHLAACQVKNVEHHTLSTVPRTGGRTKESACKLVQHRNSLKCNEPSMHCKLVPNLVLHWKHLKRTVFSRIKLKTSAVFLDTSGISSTVTNSSQHVHLYGWMFHVIQGPVSPHSSKKRWNVLPLNVYHIYICNYTHVYDSVSVWTRTYMYICTQPQLDPMEFVSRWTHSKHSVT